MKILILGASGLLGSALTRGLQEKHSIVAHGFRRTLPFDGHKKISFNALDLSLIEKNISEESPDAVIFCLAVTDVNKCENEREDTNRLNIEAPAVAAKVSQKKRIKYVFISSDAVYGEGQKGQSKETDSLPFPINHYAYTKVQAEKEILKFNSDALILRTNIFGVHPLGLYSFADEIAKRVKAGKDYNLWDDVFFNPLSIAIIADISSILLQNNAKGIFNAGSDKIVSKYTFGQDIIKKSPFPERASFLKRTSLLDMNLSVKRPMNTGMCIDKIRQFIPKEMLSYENQIIDYWKCSHAHTVCK